MKLNAIQVFVLMSLLLMGCESGTTREGYSLTQGQPLMNCKSVVLRNQILDPEKIDVVGRIEVYDTGLSIHCGEGEALAKMMKEACAVGADIVHLTEGEFRWYSSCYWAKAEFVRLRNRQEVALIKPDPYYDIMNARLRDEERWEREIKTGVEAGIMGGMIGGLAASPH